MVAIYNMGRDSGLWDAVLRTDVELITKKDQGVEGVEIFRVSSQIFLRDELDISAQHGIPETAIAAHVVDRNHTIRNRIVLESLGLPDHQNVVETHLLLVWREWNRRIRDRLILGGNEGCQDRRENDRQENDESSDFSQRHSLPDIVWFWYGGLQL